MSVALREEFTFVVVDGPPVNSCADYDLLQATCDGVILIVRQDHSERPLVGGALGAIPKEKLLGVVLNCAEDWFLWKHAAYSYYG